MGLLSRLIEQAKQPEGLVGSIMLRIMNAAHSGMNQWALGKVQAERNAVILDMGCGGGHTLRQLSQLYPDGSIYGIDYSEQAIRASIQTNSLDVETGKVKLVQADVTCLPFDEAKFDLITAFQTHYFWEELEAGIQEVNRVLRPGGYFLMVAETYKINYHMKSYRTKEEILPLFIRTGFRGVEFLEHPSRGWLCVKGTK